MDFFVAAINPISDTFVKRIKAEINKKQISTQRRYEYEDSVHMNFILYLHIDTEYQTTLISNNINIRQYLYQAISISNNINIRLY